MGKQAIDSGTTQPKDRYASIDQLSLEQALIDVEVANARVIDLTGRLTQQAGEIANLRAELATLRGPQPAPSRLSRAYVTNQIGRLRQSPIGFAKAMARRVLPAGVRARLRSALR
jgi:hypothetical protein